MEKTAKYAVPALDKCFEIIEYLAQHKRACSQAEIAQGISRSANEIFRILVNLESNGYLFRDTNTGKYRLSFKLYNVSRSISPLDELREQALPLMEDLAVECQLSCQLSVLYQSHSMVLVHAKSPGAISLSVAEGATFSALDSNSGKLLIANSNPTVQKMICERDPKWQGYTTLQKDKLLHDINTISTVDIFEAPSGLMAGVRDLTVLVGQHHGKQIAALTLSAIVSEQRDTAPPPPTFTPAQKLLLKHTAKQITQALGL